MKYSEMSPEQRKAIIDDPENYPLLVSFLGKTGLLMPPEVDFLIRSGVDFEVDDHQVAEILGISVIELRLFRGRAPSSIQEVGEVVVPPPQRRRLHLLLLRLAVAMLGGMAALLRAIRGLLRL